MVGSGIGFEAILYYKGVRFDDGVGGLGLVGPQNITKQANAPTTAENHLERHPDETIFRTPSPTLHRPVCLHAAPPQMQNSHLLSEGRQRGCRGRDGAEFYLV